MKLDTLLNMPRESFVPATALVERAYRAVERLDGDTFRMRRGEGIKRLIEEVLPIAAFAKHFEIPSRSVQCRLTGEGQRYDAEIQVSGREVEYGLLKPTYFLEVTCAVSPKDYLEREALTRNGGVFGGGDISREGSKKQGNDRIVSRARVTNGQDAVDNVIQWISERIVEKSKKDYPEPCLLIVGATPERRLDIKEWAVVATAVTKTVDHGRFAARFIVDWTTNTVFEV